MPWAELDDGVMESGVGGLNVTKVIAVASGKGGVGKTNVSVNLAVAQALRGQKVLLLDADFGLANVDVLLGLNPRRNLSHVLSNECELEEILLPGPGGIRIIPAASGVQSLAGLSTRECGGIIHAFSTLSESADLLIVDTAAGISSSVTLFAQAAHDVLIVVCDEPASITDAYALIKVLSKEHGVKRARVLANMVNGPAEGRALYRKIARVTDRFLQVDLQYAGWIPQDGFLRRSVQRQQAVVEAYPSSRATTAFKKLAEDADTWGAPKEPRGHLEFFFEKSLGSAASGSEVSP